MSVFNTKKFKKQLKEWNQILKDSGFEDIEDKNFKQFNELSNHRRTQSFKNKENIQEYFRSLGYYLNSDIDLSKRDRFILEMYSLGTQMIEIARMLDVSYRTVTAVVYKHKQIVLSLNK